MAGKRILSEAESSQALDLANKGGALVPSFSSPAPLKGAVAKANKINELADAKIDEFAASNPRLTQSTPDRLSKFGIGTPVALRHPETGEITPMVNIAGRYHHPSTFTRIAGHTNEYIPTTTGISEEMGHAKYGKPIIQPALDEGEADNLEAKAQANIVSARSRRFRIRTSGSPMLGRRFPGFGTVSGQPVGDPEGQARYIEDASKTPEFQAYSESMGARQKKLESGNWTPSTRGERSYVDPNAHLPKWLPRVDYQHDWMSKSEADSRAETVSNNMARFHNIPRRPGESTYEHVERVRGLINRAQAVASRQYEEKRKADYFAKFGKEMPQPQPPGKNETDYSATPHLGSVAETLYPVTATPPKAPTKKLNIEGTDYMHPEEFQRRKEAGLRVPNYKVTKKSDGSSSYVMEKTPVYNPKLDDEGKHIHNSEGVPQYTKSYTTAPKDYTKTAEMEPLVGITGYKRPLTQREYDYVQANIKKETNTPTKDAQRSQAREDKSIAREAAERAAEKARRDKLNADFQPKK